MEMRVKMVGFEDVIRNLSMMAGPARDRIIKQSMRSAAYPMLKQAKANARAASVSRSGDVPTDAEGNTIGGAAWRSVTRARLAREPLAETLVNADFPGFLAETNRRHGQQAADEQRRQGTHRGKRGRGERAEHAKSF